MAAVKKNRVGRAGIAAVAAELEEKQKKKFEILCGIVIAFFAAVLAVTDLGAGKYGDDEIIAHNEKSNAYIWYQSKGIKQSLAEGQRDLLTSLVESGAIQKEKAAGVRVMTEKLGKDIERYGKEKKEIHLGSSAVGKRNWVQDVDGKLGGVIGAKQWEQNADVLGKAGDVFDLSTLFLQLCIVLGAIALVLQIDRFKWIFFGAMTVLGCIGMIIAVKAFLTAFGAPPAG
jgi:hypothetical protein